VSDKLQRPRYTSAINVRCPHCGAKPGERCISPSLVFPGELDYFHLPRRAAANDTRLKATIGDMVMAKRE
jgi:hypothetical protein